MEDAFFRMDNLFGKICQNREIEAQYCRDLSEVMCFLMLPETAFDVPAARYMVREMVALQGIQATVDMVSNPVRGWQNTECECHHRVQRHSDDES